MVCLISSAALFRTALEEAALASLAQVQPVDFVGIDHSGRNHSFAACKTQCPMVFLLLQQKCDGD